jgi:hypothetical protein
MVGRALAITLPALALASAGALAAASITKRSSASVAIAPGATRALAIAYPDALEYANARYSGAHRLARQAGARGAAPKLAKVAILQAQSVEGGSLYRVRARNDNAPGSAAVRLTVTATTVEPLPHR